MSQAPSNPAANNELLPDGYDELLAVEELIHGEHNPRRVRPSETLKQSIAGFGINKPLIVRPDPEEDVYHITDGWQRYQAAVSCGWEQLPVQIYEDTLDALEATEMESIVREWSTYEWARYCHSLAAEIETDSDSKAERARQVAARTSRQAETVRRYIDVLSLPEEVHILLSDGPDGSEQQWNTLKNFNEDVRQYGELQWQVADRLARNQSGLSEMRIIEIAATAVEFQTVEQAVEFVDLAVANPETRVDVIHRKVLFGKNYDQYLVIPRVSVKLSTDEKRAIMDHCHEQRQSLSKIVSEGITTLAEDLTNSNGDDTEPDGESDAECQQGEQSDPTSLPTEDS